MTHVYHDIQLADQIFWRLRPIEALLALMAYQLGLRHHDPASMTPAEVVERLDCATERGGTPTVQRMVQRRTCAVAECSSGLARRVA
jgi:hypothetical protein